MTKILLVIHAAVLCIPCTVQSLITVEILEKLLGKLISHSSNGGFVAHTCSLKAQ